MEPDKLFFEIFRIAGLVLLFICAVAIFLNILGYMLVGGEVKKSSDISLCKLAISNCITSRMGGTTDCENTCLPCSGNWYEKCLIGDASLLKW